MAALCVSFDAVFMILESQLVVKLAIDSTRASGDTVASGR